MASLVAADEAKRRPGRPRALAVTDQPLSDWEAFGRLRANHALNSLQGIRVMAFCSVWQRVGGRVDAVVALGHCGERTAYSRLASCRRAGFEPELVRWLLQDGEWWEGFADHELKHADDEFARDVQAYMRLSAARRALRRRPRPHPDQLEDTSQ